MENKKEYNKAIDSVKEKENQEDESDYQDGYFAGYLHACKKMPYVFGNTSYEEKYKFFTHDDKGE